MKAILGSMTFAKQVNQETATEMVQRYVAAGGTEVDTAYVYVEGKTEEMLGTLNQQGELDQCRIATKVNPHAGGLGAASVDQQFSTSLQRMDMQSVDLLYLHQPDLNTPIAETLEAIQRHAENNRIKRFGLSNYAAWQVAQITELCDKNGWIKPTVYQGMYNAITRDVERELFLCLADYNIAFYAYNPLAGGLLTGKHQQVSADPAPGRFDGNAEYQRRYWNASYFDAVNQFCKVCEQENIEPARAAIRWLVHHSDLQSSKGDGVIIGASSMAHFEANHSAMSEGPLPDCVVDSLQQGWEAARPVCIKYFRP
jgi:aflatoxin B1 aldehyde reductase